MTGSKEAMLLPCGAQRSFFLEFLLMDLQVQNVFTVIVERREQVPFSMATENGELMHECCAWEQPLRIRTSRLK